MKYTVLSIVMATSLFGCGSESDRVELIPGPQGDQGIQGVAGQNGSNSLVSLIRFSSDTSVCVAGSGTIINSGVDRDNDDALENTEVSSTSVICDGATGAQGQQGTQGLQGLPGANGASCSVTTLAVGSVAAPNGGSLITCPSSSAVVKNGSNGTNGTLVIPQQFCPGYVQSYPSTFAESGLCIGGQMYGVYSANDGFLALMPSGIYQSHGINSDCTFTLSSNCKIN